MKKILLLVTWIVASGLAGIGIACAQDLVVGTYNIRNDNSNDKKEGNGW